MNVLILMIFLSKIAALNFFYDTDYRSTELALSHNEIRKVFTYTEVQS